MYQDITFANAGDYLLSFWYAPRTKTPNDNSITWAIGNAAGIISDVAPSGWRQITSVFTVPDAGSVLRLTFAASGLSNSVGGLLDDVSIEPAPAPVPLPAAGVLLAGALGGLGVVSRKRRKAA